MIRVFVFKFNVLEENCYLVYNEKFRDNKNNCILIDPGCNKEEEIEVLSKKLEEKSLSPAGILLTHLHFDHIGGVSRLLKIFGPIPVYMCRKDWDLLSFNTKAIEQFFFPKLSMDFETIDIEDNQVLELAGLNIKCISTPGHTAGGFCYLIDDKLFSGDTLFAGAIGRSDFPTGEYDDLIRSIMDKLMLLDSDIEVFPGHGPSTNIGYERMNNPFLEPFNEKEEDFEK